MLKVYNIFGSHPVVEHHNYGMLGGIGPISTTYCTANGNRVTVVDKKNEDRYFQLLDLMENYRDEEEE